VAEPNRALVQPLLRGYVPHRFRLRVWWSPDWGGGGITGWLEWLVARTPWSPTASLDEILYLRPDVARLTRSSRSDVVGRPRASAVGPG
jgi:hypothetical protein